MWFYLFGRSERDPDPAGEIGTLAELDERGEGAFLRLSARDDAPLKAAGAGERVYLCTREGGRWSIHGEAVVAGPPVRGEPPPSMAPLHGPAGERHWWRRLEHIRLYEEPKSLTDLGFREDLLPASGQAHVIRVGEGRNGTATALPTEQTPSPLDQLTAALDAAWDEGRVTPEAIDAAVRRFREAHPYGR